MELLGYTLQVAQTSFDARKSNATGKFDNQHNSLHEPLFESEVLRSSWIAR